MRLRPTKLGQDEIAWGIGQYNSGAVVKDICNAMCITPTTFYRYLEEAPEGAVTSRRRTPTKQANTLKSEAAKRRWAVQQDPLKKALKQLRTNPMTGRERTTLDLLHRLNLTLGSDNLGHYIGRGEGKAYMTHIEYKRMQKDPVSMIKTMAGRINAAIALTNNVD